MSIRALTDYVKPADLRFDPTEGLWTYDASIFGVRIPFAGTHCDALCAVINDNIRIHAEAHNTGTPVEAAFYEAVRAAAETLASRRHLRLWRIALDALLKHIQGVIR